MAQFLVLSIACLCGLVASQSNYADQANNVGYQGEGLPESATLDGKVTKLDDLSPVIFLNRTKAALNCAAGSMQIELKFNDKFYGIAYADFDRNSACQVAGKGATSYKLELPLKGCGTKQDPQRVFTNNIVVRFHPGLEIDGDEIITIVCRYPPPVAPLPALPPPPAPDYSKQEPLAVVPPLTGFQILLIICAILFLSLLLLGLGCSYYCLRRRRMTPIRQPYSAFGPESEITSTSLPITESIKIPRVVAPLAAQESISDSEGPLITSDYPSESHSEDNASSAASFENKAYVVDTATPVMVPRLPMAIKEQPKFDVQVRVKKVPPPKPPSLTTSDTESSASRIERNLSTIIEPMPERTQFTYVPELHAPPKHVQPAPTFTRILRRHQEMHEEVDAPLPPPPPIILPEITSHTVDDLSLRTITERKTIEDIERHKRLITEYHARPKPVDQKWDVTIKNYPVPMPEPPDWENFSDVSSASGMTLTPKMERSRMTLPPQSQISDNKLPLSAPELVGNVEHHTSTHEEITSETFLKTFNIPRENPQVPNWNVLIRVLQPLDEEGPVIESAESFNAQLTMTDRMKWRQIITTESTLRTLLTEAVVREDFERIRRDTRYERLFEPPKWDVIIRILAPDRPRNQPRKSWDLSRRKSLPILYEYDSDGGSSVRTITKEPMVRPHLPTIGHPPAQFTYRSEGELRSMTVQYGRPDHGQPETSTYYPDPPRYYGDHDVVDYNHPSLARSLSQPSLARSGSEFTERWVAPSRYDTASEFTSPEGTPQSQRSTRIQPLHIPRETAQQSSVWAQASSSRVGQTTGGGRVVAQEYRREMATSFRSANQNWFGDNDSEASYK